MKNLIIAALVAAIAVGSAIGAVESAKSQVLHQCEDPGVHQLYSYYKRNGGSMSCEEWYDFRACVGSYCAGPPVSDDIRWCSFSGLIREHRQYLERDGTLACEAWVEAGRPWAGPDYTPPLIVVIPATPTPEPTPSGRTFYANRGSQVETVVEGNYDRNVVSGIRVSLNRAIKYFDEKYGLKVFFPFKLEITPHCPRGLAADANEARIRVCVAENDTNDCEEQRPLSDHHFTGWNSVTCYQRLMYHEYVHVLHSQSALPFPISESKRSQSGHDVTDHFAWIYDYYWFSQPIWCYYNPETGNNDLCGRTAEPRDKLNHDWLIAQLSRPRYPYPTCASAREAGAVQLRGSQGTGEGFPASLIPTARDGDGDGVVCEQ